MSYSQEPEFGAVEFKYNLIKWGDHNLGDGASQMNYRLMEGKGKCTYKIGITDKGIPLGIHEEDFDFTVNMIKKMAERLSADVTLKSKVLSPLKLTGTAEQSLFKKANNHLAEFNISKPRFLGTLIITSEAMIEKAKTGLEVRETLAEHRPFQRGNLNVCILGNVDAGKSSLLGVLIKGKLDDGRGAARSTVLNYRHELLSGRSTSIVYKYMVFDNTGTQVFDDVKVDDNFHVVTVFDTCGHEKYFKTTARCVYSSYADYCFVLVEAKAGITAMTKEHIHLVSSSGKRLVILVTRTDLCPEDALLRTRAQLKSALRRVNLLPVTSETDIREYVSDTSSCVPVLEVSSVTGQNISLLRSLIYQLPILRKPSEKSDQVTVVLERTYTVKGIGKVVSGYVKSGNCRVGSTLQVGPNRSGQYIPVGIKSIYYVYYPTEVAKEGQMCTFALTRVEKAAVHRGMIMTSHPSPAVREFTAKIKIIGRHSTAIKAGYEPMLTINNTDQVARLTELKCVKRAVERADTSDSYLFEGDTGEVTFRLKYFPMHLLVGDKFYLREGKSRGFGVVLTTS